MAVSTTRHMTAMPISMGLPRRSFIFWRELLRVIILRETFLPVSSATVMGLTPVLRSCTALDAPPSTSPLWLSFVLAAGLTPMQKGLTK